MPWVGSCGEGTRSLRFDSSAEFGMESSRSKGPLWFSRPGGLLFTVRVPGTDGSKVSFWDRVLPVPVWTWRWGGVCQLLG